MGWLVREGKDGDRREDRRMEIPSTGTLLCGRSSRADLVLDETAVSRRHAIFFHESERDWVRDAGSMNGTRVNGTVVRDPAPLRDGDRVAIGIVELVYREYAVGGSLARPPRRKEAEVRSAAERNGATPSGGPSSKRAAAPAAAPTRAERLLSDTKRWREVTLIGRGGMGEVYRAHDRDLAVEVAIKRLRRREGTDLRLMERLHAREAALGRTIEHPNVVRVLEEAVLEEDPLLLLEWVAGKDVAARGAQLGMIEKLEVLRQTALGLDAAHRAGVVHADLKPANLLLCESEPPRGAPSENIGIFAEPESDEDSLDPDLAAEIRRRLGVATDDGTPDLTRLPFVGRDAELSYLREIAEEVRDGGLRWVLLHGERGVGRSTLIAEAERRARGDANGPGLEIESSGGEERTPWGAVVASPASLPSGREGEDELPWAPPPVGFEGVWITPLPPFLPEDELFEKAVESEREAGRIRTLYLKPFLRGEAIRCVETACGQAQSARAFVDAIDRTIWSSPALLVDALADAFRREAWRPSGAGYRLEVSALRPDERTIATQWGERLRGEEKGVRDLLSRISPFKGPLDFAAIGEITGFDSATLYYLLGHIESVGYLERVREGAGAEGVRSEGGFRFGNEIFRRALDHALRGEERATSVRRTLGSIERRLDSDRASAEILLAGAALAVEEGRVIDAFRWSVRGALVARQGYDRERFYAAVDAARNGYRHAREGAERKALQSCGEELLGPGGRGLVGLDRLRALPIGVGVKITDFGIARRVEREEKEHEEGEPGRGAEARRDPVPWGTPRYMSPEQGLARPLGTASDIFSLGIVARELLEGAHPLGASKGKSAVAQILADTLAGPPPTGKSPDPLALLLHRMLSLEPKHRPSALEVADELQRVQIRAALADR